MPDAIEFRGAGGVRLVGDRRGPADAPTVLLLHGGGQTRYSWGGTADALASAGWQAITVDARGTARANGFPTATTGSWRSPRTSA